MKFRMQQLMNLLNHKIGNQSTMEVVNTKLEFTFQRKKYVGELSMFTPVKTPMLRVRIDTKEFKELVFVFYKVKKGELFWYPLEDLWKQGMAEAIAALLTEALLT